MFRKGIMINFLKEGHEVFVLAPYDDYSKQIEELGCQYIEVPMDNKGASIFKDLLLLRRLYKHYKKILPDLIFHYTIKPNIFGTMAAHYAKTKSIAVITGLGYTFINQGLAAKAAKQLYKLALPKSRKVWFINHEDRKMFIKEGLLSRDLIEILPGEGVDMVKYSPIEKSRNDGKFVFVLIARLLWDKGVGEFVQAAKEIKKTYQNTEFQLVGFVDVKNPQAISKEQVLYWVEKGWITYKGSTNDVRDFISSADCVVLPSYREGISKILLESASMKKPIIASNVPGCRDVVENAGSGYLCKVKNTNDLILKMEKMLTLSKSELLNMGEKGRNLVKDEFDENIIIKKYSQSIKYHTLKGEENGGFVKKY